jgi:hypothetical protein
MIFEEDAFEILKTSREELEDFFHVWTRKPVLFDFARRVCASIFAQHLHSDALLMVSNEYSYGTMM